MALEEAGEVPARVEFDLVKALVAPERPADDFAGQLGALAFVRQQAAAARVISEGGLCAGKQRPALRGFVLDRGGRIGRAVMLELGLARALKLRDDALGQNLAQFHAPLIEGVDLP